MRHTKIVATAGPATATDELLDALIEAGVDIFRLNFSHGTHDTHAEMFHRIRRSAARAGRLVAIMQDLSGPKIRIGVLEGDRPLDLVPGVPLVIETGDFEGRPGRVSTTYAELARSVVPGDRLLLDDGRIELAVEDSDGKAIRTRVVYGGPLGAHKGINAPGVLLPSSAMTAKDVGDASFGAALGVDLAAVSFVQTADDMKRAREVFSAAGRQDIGLVAKIERPRAVECLDEILAVSDGVMVARGDLGLELPLERVPRAQKEITRAARARGVPVIVATQVLESMRTQARPTRAEVSDAANAVDDGVDAIMLAGETAVGAFPVRAVHTLALVIAEAEAAQPFTPWIPRSDKTDDHVRALCEAAVTLATTGQAAAIVAVTRGGTTARTLSALRPRAPVFAATADDAAARRLALLWGVTPLVVALSDDVNATASELERQLLSRGVLPSGSTVVLVSVDHDLSRPGVNFLKISRVG